MKKKFYRPILYYLLITIKNLFSLLPYETGYRAGASLGRLVFFLLKKEREKTLAHLKLAFGDEKTEQELFHIGKRVFENYGKVAAELALIDKLIPRFKDYVITTGYEHLDQGLRDGKGIITVTAHFGNWELMGGFSAYNGYPLTGIARRIYYDKFDKLLVNTRAKMKVKTIYRDDSVKKILSVLKKNEVLGFAVDQDMSSVDGVFVNFFGRPAYTSTAPVRFAMATGAPLIPAFVVREGI